LNVSSIWVGALVVIAGSLVGLFAGWIEKPRWFTGRVAFSLSAFAVAALVAAAPRSQRPAVSPAPAQLAAPGDATWRPVGQAAHAGGYTIHGGLVYAGSGLAAEKGRMPEPALIDPRLPVDARAPDYAGTKMGYWPPYASIPSECRAAYLHWLLDGRRAPSAYIGYVFLYFYGLERRLLVDSLSSPTARAEHPALVREVGRLLSIYRANGSFRGYASDLLRFVSLGGGPRHCPASAATRSATAAAGRLKPYQPSPKAATRAGVPSLLPPTTTGTRRARRLGVDPHRREPREPAAYIEAGCHTVLVSK
jgi:hypothetical protein